MLMGHLQCAEWHCEVTVISEDARRGFRFVKTEGSVRNGAQVFTLPYLWTMSVYTNFKYFL